MQRPPQGAALREAPHTAIDAPSAVDRPELYALSSCHKVRRLGGVWGASRSARQTAGVPFTAVGRASAP